METTGERRPRTRPPEERRKGLMDAAERLFLAQGVAATTIEQITQGAGVSKGAFYLYFASKQQVRAALGERFGRSHLAHIQAATRRRRESDWWARLAAWTEASAGFYLDQIRLHDMLFYEASAPSREGLVENVVIDDLEALLRAGAEAGAWAAESPRAAAVFLFSGVHGVVDDAVIRAPPVNRKRLLAEIRALCFGAVGRAT